MRPETAETPVKRASRGVCPHKKIVANVKVSPATSANAQLGIGIGCWQHYKASVAADRYLTISWKPTDFTSRTISPSTTDTPFTQFGAPEASETFAFVNLPPEVSA